jgi:hypothetical protein
MNYMKLYFACKDAIYGNLVNQNGESGLFSFYYLRKSQQLLDCATKRPGVCFLDSGAFSALNFNETLKVEEYIDFIKKTANWGVYAGLDVIGNPVATQENQEKMEKAGLSPIPTFHLNSPDTVLMEMCERYKYIALGGLVPISRKKREINEWLYHCFSIIKKNWPIKVHGFGVNSPDLWLKYPFYSVDATSWLSSARYGRDMFIKDRRMEKFEAKKVHYLVRAEGLLAKYRQKADEATRFWTLRGIKW